MAAKWRDIGLALGLNFNDLEKIRASEQGINDRLTDMLSLWLRRAYNVKGHGEPSWQKLSDAVKSPAGGNDPALADELSENDLFY